MRARKYTAVNPPAHARRTLISVEIGMSVEIRKSLEKSRNQEIREEIRQKLGYRGKSPGKSGNHVYTLNWSVSVTQHLTYRMFIRPTNDMTYLRAMMARKFVWFKYSVAELERFQYSTAVASRPFYSAENAHAYYFCMCSPFVTHAYGIRA